MAVYQWITGTAEDSLQTAIIPRLVTTQFRIDDSGTTDVQISALYSPKEIVTYWSGVRMLATWLNFSERTIKIEVRSDEPMLRVNTHCERSARELMRAIPPIY